MKLITLSLFMIIISPALSLNSPYKIKQLCRENYRLVSYFAKKYIQNNPLTYDERNELIQEGYIGLMEAAKRFDESRKYKFSTYGSWWIHKYLSNYIKKKNKNKKNLIHTIEFNESIHPDKKKIEKEIYMDILNKPERDMLYKRYYQKLSRAKVAQEYGVSEATITQKCKQSIDKLKVFQKKLNTIS